MFFTTSWVNLNDKQRYLQINFCITHSNIIFFPELFKKNMEGIHKKMFKKVHGDLQSIGNFASVLNSQKSKISQQELNKVYTQLGSKFKKYMDSNGHSLDKKFSEILMKMTKSKNNNILWKMIKETQKDLEEYYGIDEVENEEEEEEEDYRPERVPDLVKKTKKIKKVARNENKVKQISKQEVQIYEQQHDGVDDFLI